MFLTHADRPAPEHLTVSDLGPAERLVVWAIRQWIESPRNWCLVEQEFRSTCSIENAMVALNGLSGLISVISRRSRRTLWFHRARCARVSADERSLLTLIAGAQADNETHVRALLHWLLPGDAIETGAAHAARLADGLRRANLIVPHRASADGDPRRRASDGPVDRVRLVVSREPGAGRKP